MDERTEQEPENMAGSGSPLSAWLAGRELDVRIAERVMGLTVAHPRAAPLRFTQMDGVIHPHCMPPYSRDIAAAWNVVQRLNVLGWTVGLEQVPTPDGVQWRCDLHRDPFMVVDAFADTAPLAICDAALMAVADG